MHTIVSPSFFSRPAPDVARALIGMDLVRRWRGKDISLMITETEAYHGVEDRASHASRGKTSRNAVMFGPSGVCYIYLVYGMYEMLNIVTGDEGCPSAVLIRGIEGYDGPGKLTRALRIDRLLNGTIARPDSGLWFEDRGVTIDQSCVMTTPRIGVAYAGPEWAGKPYRFVLQHATCREK